jgi:hypothetical protein
MKRVDFLGCVNRVPFLFTSPPFLPLKALYGHGYPPDIPLLFNKIGLLGKFYVCFCSFLFFKGIQ